MEGRDDFRRSAQRLLDIFVMAVEEHAKDGKIAMAELRAASRAMLGAPTLRRFLDSEYDRMTDGFAVELQRRKRADPLQRLMCHPLSDEFEQGRLSREIIPNYFNFIHLVMGEAKQELSERCLDIMEDLHQLYGDEANWDMFYEDPRAKHVLWTVLVRIAESFRRFELRRDWFINLMQYTPQAVSLASNAFIPRPTEKTPEEANRSTFGPPEFYALFTALFAPMKRLSPTDMALFRTAMKSDPARLFGPLWVKLAEAGFTV